MRHIKILSWLSVFLFLFHCKGNTESPIADITVKGIKVKDYNNNANASDIVMSFTKPANTDLVKEFRIIISQSTEDLTLEKVSSLQENQFFTVDTKSSPSDINLPSSLIDSNGEAIEEGIQYFLSVESVGSSIDNQLSKPSKKFTLERTNLVRTLVENVNGGSGGVAIDENGDLYMADFGQTLGGPPGDKVYKITPSGNVSVFATGFVGASGNDFDSKGNLFQSNIAGQSISKITQDGTVTNFASGDPIVNTVGISIDDNDELYVADCDGHKVLKIDKNGTIEVFATSSLFNCPNGITRDDSGNLYTSNFYDGNVLKITPSKQVSLLATLPGKNNGHLTYHRGYLYVIARTANQIYKVSLIGETELFAGSGDRGSQNGSALESSFSLPNDLIFSNDGSKIYINDVVPTTGNNISPCKIRVIELVE